MVSETLCAAESSASSNIWFVVVSLASTLLSGFGGHWITSRNDRAIAQETAQAQLAAMREEGRTKAKVEAINDFLIAVDAYWQMANDLFEVRRKAEGRRWRKVVRRRGQAPEISFRQATSAQTANLTRSQIRMEAFSHEELRRSADRYVAALRQSALDANRAQMRQPKGKNELMECVRKELDIL